METLPIEVISHIMRFLSLEDRKRCSLACRRFHVSLKEDPVLNSRICCRLGIYDSPQRYIEVSKFVSLRSITQLHFFAQPGNFWVGEETSFWIHISDKFTAIDTLYLNESATKDLQAEIILNIATSFPSVKTIKLSSSILDNVTRNEQLLSSLGKIPRLILVIKAGSSLRPYPLNLNIQSLVIKYFEITRDRRPEKCSVAFYDSDTAWRALTSVSLDFFCSFHFEDFRVDLPQLNLSEIVAKLCTLPRVTMKHLTVSLSSSVTGDESSCLYQISEFGLDCLSLYSPCKIHSWFSGEFLSSIIHCEKLKLICCIGKFDQITLLHFFSYCPLIESVDIGISGVVGHDGLEPPWIEVKFRNSSNSRLRELHLHNRIGCNVSTHFLESLALLPSSLREFKLRGTTKLTHPAIFINLGNRCPNIRKLTIELPQGFSQSDHLQNLLSKLGNLEYLSLSPFIPFTNLSFPHLKTLMLSQKASLPPGALAEIAHSSPRLKCLLLSYGGNVYNDGLKSALTVLKDLEELGLGKATIDETTFDVLSQFAPSLRLLKLSGEGDNFKKQVRKYQDKHPNVLVQISLFWLQGMD